MSLRATLTAGAGMLSLTTDGFCQSQVRVYYTPHSDPLLDLIVFLGLCLASLLLGRWLVGWLSSGSSDGPCGCAECVAKREASLIRELTKHQDAQTARMRSEIDHARTYGEYRERADIAAHEQRLRELRSRLR